MLIEDKTNNLKINNYGTVKNYERLNVSDDRRHGFCNVLGILSHFATNSCKSSRICMS